MVFFVFGTYRSTRVSPDERELLQGNLRCANRGCGGRVRAIDVERRFHFCFIPLCPLGTTHNVYCLKCQTSKSLTAHAATAANLSEVPIAKARVVVVPVATPLTVATAIQDVGKAELIQEDTETSSDASEEPLLDEPTFVEAKDITIV